MYMCVFDIRYSPVVIVAAILPTITITISINTVYISGYMLCPLCYLLCESITVLILDNSANFDTYLQKNDTAH